MRCEGEGEATKALERRARTLSEPTCNPHRILQQTKQRGRPALSCPAQSPSQSQFWPWCRDRRLPCPAWSTVGIGRSVGRYVVELASGQLMHQWTAQSVASPSPSRAREQNEQRLTDLHQLPGAPPSTLLPFLSLPRARARRVQRGAVRCCCTAAVASGLPVAGTMGH